jgi:uncharacterized protein involved in exopolysaccharide biosynthesis
LDNAASVVKRLIRHWWVIALVTVLGTGAAVAVALLKAPLYQSEVVILSREVIRSDVLYGGEGEARKRDDVAARLQEAALARPRLQAIIDELEIYPEIVKERGVVAAVELMRQRIEFKAKGNDVFYVSFLGETPDQAYQVTQQLAETLINVELIARAEQVTATKNFLEKELETAKSDLGDRESTVAKFLEKHPEFALDTFNMAAPGASYRARQAKSLTEPIIAQKSSDALLNALFREEARLQQRLRDVERKGARPELASERDRADEDLQSARRDFAEQSRRFTEKHPDVVAAQARLHAAERRAIRAQEAVKRDIATSRGEETGTVQRDLEAARTKIRERRAQLKRDEKEKDEKKGEKKGEAGTREAKTPQKGSGKDEKHDKAEIETVSDVDTEWVRLYRELQEARERYSALETKHFRAEIDANSQIAAQANQMSIIDPAYVPLQPHGAGKRVVVIAGFAAATLLGFGLALLLALMDDRIFERREFERLAIMPVLVTVPRDAVAKKNRKRPPTAAPTG